MWRFAIALAAALAVALASGVAGAAETLRYVGTAKLGEEPPLPIHVELRREGPVVTGLFTIPGEEHAVSGSAADNEIKGRIGPGGSAGEFTLRLKGETADGVFVFGGAPGVLSLKRTTADAQTALGPPPQNLDLTAEQWRADLGELVRILTQEHGSPFHRVPRSEFEAEVARIRSQIPTTSGPHLAAAFRKLSSMIGDGHTGVDLPRGQPRYPIATFWFEDGLRVVQTTPEHRRLLGARVEAVAGVPFKTLASRLRPYSPMGENDWSWRAVLPYLINRPTMLQSVGVASETPTSWTFRRPDGRQERVLLTPAAFPVEGRVLLGGTPPLWAQRPDEPFWTDFWADSGTLYVNFRSYQNLAANAARLAAELDARRPRRLVLDMRDNGGGDYVKGRELLLPVITSRPWLNRRDRTFVLVGRHTFSAAMSNAADFRWRTNTTLVGEPIGEKPNSWQESRRFYLPHSGLPVSVSTKFYKFAPDGVEQIEPHVRAEPDWRDWARGRDTAIDRILATRPPRRDGGAS
ncbi:MAG: hypothetical protein M3M95_05730 [Pseudomonadota bacterium]|nr:hypothetical protein [Pseudomonadota bacterium]